MTLDDLERPIRTIAEKMLFGAHQKKIGMNIDPYTISAETCS